MKKETECLILILNLKASKQTSKNKVIFKRVSNISISLVNLTK